MNQEWRDGGEVERDGGEMGGEAKASTQNQGGGWDFLGGSV